MQLETGHTKLANVIGDEFFTVDETAVGLKLTPNWFYQRIHAGTLPFPYLKIGHYVRIPASGLKKFLEAQMRSATCEVRFGNDTTGGVGGSGVPNP